MQVRDTGLYSEGSEFFSFLKTPHTFVDFHLPGTVPFSIESWKILARIGAISTACFLETTVGWHQDQKLY